MTQTEITDQVIEGEIIKSPEKNMSAVAKDLGVERKRVKKVWETISDRVQELIADGQTNEKIIEATGLPLRAIAAFRSWSTRTQRAEKRREEEKADDALEVHHSLERDLQDNLRSNISALDPNLKIIDGGKERWLDGRRLKIDILAQDPDGTLVVVELKAGKARPDVVAQTLGYMGVLAEEDQRPVRGIVVASEFDQAVVDAATAVPNLSLRSYTMRFIFDEP